MSEHDELADLLKTWEAIDLERGGASRADALARAAAAITSQGERIAMLERVAIDLAASLAASISILERADQMKKQPNRAVASDTMFAQMLRDYRASLVRARAALVLPAPPCEGE